METPVFTKPSQKSGIIPLDTGFPPRYNSMFPGNDPRFRSPNPCENQYLFSRSRSSWPAMAANRWMQFVMPWPGSVSPAYSVAQNPYSLSKKWEDYTTNSVCGSQSYPGRPPSSSWLACSPPAAGAQ